MVDELAVCVKTVDSLARAECVVRMSRCLIAKTGTRHDVTCAWAFKVIFQSCSSHYA